jgi:hypothetical protein
VTACCLAVDGAALGVWITGIAAVVVGVISLWFARRALTDAERQNELGERLVEVGEQQIKLGQLQAAIAERLARPQLSVVPDGLQQSAIPGRFEVVV